MHREKTLERSACDYLCVTPGGWRPFLLLRKPLVLSASFFNPLLQAMDSEAGEGKDTTATTTATTTKTRKRREVCLSLPHRLSLPSLQTPPPTLFPKACIHTHAHARTHTHTHTETHCSNNHPPSSSPLLSSPPRPLAVQMRSSTPQAWNEWRSSRRPSNLAVRGTARPLLSAVCAPVLCRAVLC